MNRRNFGKATVAIALAPGVAPVSVAMSFEERMIFKIGDSLGIEKRDIQFGGGYCGAFTPPPRS